MNQTQRESEYISKMESRELRVQYDQGSFEELTDRLKILAERAQSASEGAYAPYSKFKVGVAALLNNGELVTAANQESVAFPAGLCAERVLLFSVLNQFPGVTIRTIAVTAISDGVMQSVSPCGICRQTLIDVEARQVSPIEILFYFEGRYILLNSAHDLLPFSFSSRMVGGGRFK